MSETSKSPATSATPETTTTPATPEAPSITPKVSELPIVIPKSDSRIVNFKVTKWAKANHIPTVVTDPKLQTKITEYGLPWFRAGAVVANGEGKILMIHEGRVQVKKIKDPVLKEKYLSEGYKPSDWVDGDGGWNLPSGRLNPGEAFEDAAERETLEESGWSAVVTRYLFARTSEKPDNQYYMPVFLATAVRGPAEFHTFETRETLEIGWFTPDEIRDMRTANMLRSPEFVIGALDVYEAVIA